MDHNKLWKIPQEMGIPEDLTFLLRNVYAGQEETVRTGHGTTEWFQIGKGVRQSCLLSPCLFSLYAEHIRQNARLDELQAGIKTARRRINKAMVFPVVMYGCESWTLEKAECQRIDVFKL